jgi:hypothetical protein
MPSNQPETPTLLPCPFCGGDATAVGTDHPSWLQCRVHCNACATATCSYATRALAAAAWNTRAVAQPETPSADALDAAVEEAKKELLFWVGFAGSNGYVKVDALVAAVEARAVARAERVCAWEEGEARHYATECGEALSFGGPPLENPPEKFCSFCGGRVRVEGDA